MYLPQTMFRGILVLLATLFTFCHGGELLQSVKGNVGAGNYTYYRLSRVGALKVELVSLSGDADLYVSDTTLNPTYDHYIAQSISCGKDIIEIPETYVRPIGIGVYGYPGTESSDFVLSIYQMPKNVELSYEQLRLMFHNYEAADHLFTNYDASDYLYRDIKHQSSSASNQDLSEDEEETFGSVLWQILVTLLKVVFEVIL